MASDNYIATTFFQGSHLRFVNPRYMKGRLTLDKVNAAINDMAAYADVNFQLITAPRKKVLHLSKCLLSHNTYAIS